MDLNLGCIAMIGTAIILAWVYFVISARMISAGYEKAKEIIEEKKSKIPKGFLKFIDDVKRFIKDLAELAKLLITIVVIGGGIIFFLAVYLRINASAEIFPEKGECITSNNLIVLQTLTNHQANHQALAIDELSSQIMLLKNEDNTYYYDNMIVNIPSKKCARQIGIYRYETKNKDLKTVPFVIIDSK